jgi:hypothetical protein
MNDSARAGLETLAERGEPRGADAVVAAARVAVRRARRRGRAVLALGVLLLVGVVATVVVTSGGDERREVVTQPAPEGGDAPPEDKGPVRLWLSEPVVPSSGADLLFVLRNSGAASPVFGVPTYLDRWDGTAWQEVMLFAACQGTVPCARPLERVTEWDLVGLLAPPGGFGGGEWVHVSGLDTGWYRFRKVANEGDVATGRFEVVDHPVDLVPVEQAGEMLTVGPVLSSRAQIPQVAVVVTHSIPAGGEDVIEAALSPTMELERWVDGAWHAEMTLDFSAEARIDADHVPGRRYFDLPALEPGAYRLTRTFSDGRELRGQFWVAADLAPAQPNPVPWPVEDTPIRIWMSDRVLPASGAVVATSLRNDTTTSETFGLETWVDVWNGTEWVPVKHTSVCRDGAHCAAELRPADEPVAILAVGFLAAPGQPGILEWLHIAGLDPGRYRLRKESASRVTATGHFEVVGGPSETLELDPHGDTMIVDPPIVSTTCWDPSCVVMLRASASFWESNPAVFEASLSAAVGLDRWETGRGWIQAADLDFSVEALLASKPVPGSRWVELPPDLDPGAYRVVRTTPDGEPVYGYIWITRTGE